MAYQWKKLRKAHFTVLDEYVLFLSCSILFLQYYIQQFALFILFSSIDHTCYNFIMIEATKSRRDFNEWCLLWLIKIDFIFSIDKILEYQLLAQLDGFNFLFLFCEGGLRTLINGSDYTGKVSTGARGSSTWVTFFLIVLFSSLPPI